MKQKAEEKKKIKEWADSPAWEALLKTVREKHKPNIWIDDTPF